jgi:hypothetical protein
MTSIDKVHRGAAVGRRVVAGEPAALKVSLEALQAALRGGGGQGGGARKAITRSASTGGSDAADAPAAKASSAAATASTAAKAPAGQIDLYGDFGLPPNPTPAQIARLTTGIRAAIQADSGKSDRDPSPHDPETMTPLQRLLFTVVNGMPRELLEQHPELLAAVQDGFATEGGRQLALTVNMMDGGLAGDGSDPLGSQPEWISLLQPQTIAHLAFDLDPKLPAPVKAAVMEWISQAQQSEAGRAQLAALMQGSRTRIRLGGTLPGAQVTLTAESRAITLKAGSSPQQLQQGLDELATRLSAMPNAPTSVWKRYRDAVKRLAGTGQSGEALLSYALRFDRSVPEGVQRIIRAAADNSPTLRNALARSIAQHGTITVSVSETSFGAQISLAGGRAKITVASASEELMAESIVFELCNAAQLSLLRETGRPSESPFSPSELDALAAKMYRGAMKVSTLEKDRFLSWARSQPKADEYRKLGLKSASVDSSLMEDLDLIKIYLHRSFTPHSVRQAALKAFRTESQEMDSVLLVGQIGAEVGEAKSRGPVGRSASALTSEAVKILQRWTASVQSWASTGNVRAAAVNVQIEAGHTGDLFRRYLHGRQGTFARPSADPALEEGALPEGGATHPAADAALTEAGTAAGAAAHTDLRTAVDTHGPANRAAIAEAAEASLWKRSQALAAQILDHPAVKSGLRLTGRGVNAAAYGLMVYGLAKAIHTDVKNGDHSAPATRKALSELLGGLSLGVGGAAVGARVGAALGALVGPITAAVGGFVGGLFGGALGFAAGTRLVDRALENNKKPLDHLIDSVLDQQGDIAAVNAGAIGALQTLTGSGGGGCGSDDRSLPGGAPQAQPEAPAEPSQDQLNLAQRVVQAGSRNDRYANRKELIAGFEEARYDLKAGQPGTDFSDAFAVNRLIATYGASGSGALTEDELAQAIADGAFVIHDDGTVTVDTAVLHARQRSHAGHIASRVVDAGAKAETADEGDLRDGFGEAGYSLKASGKDIDALMRVFGDANGRIGKSALAAAIQVGAVVIAADGTVTVDRAVLALAA